MNKSLSFGDITESRFWLSIERRPYNKRRWYLSFGPTYSGTVAGICFCVPWFTILGHIRKKQCNTPSG